MFFEYLVMFFVCVLLFTFIVTLACLPIIIANSRGISGNKKTAIVVLSLLGLFCGITWFVALILSVVWNGDGACCCAANLDSLEKLARLYKDKVISKSEYEKMKSKLIQE